MMHAPASTLTESRALFVRRWGEMAAYWGISRTMAEIHARLYASDRPLCTDELMSELAISRGNASMNLRALVDWGLIERVHLRGDRKEYFTAIPDAWGMFQQIIRQRRRREVEPILETLRRCQQLVGKEAQARGESHGEARVFHERLEEMRRFLETFGSLVELVLKLGPNGLKRVTTMLAKFAG